MGFNSAFKGLKASRTHSYRRQNLNLSE